MPDTEVQQSPQWADMGAGRRDEPTIYYKKPDGWIVGGATQMSAQMGMLRKGFRPLPQYGTIESSEDFWGPILRHPDGPAEFPVEQVLTFRWYRKDRLPDLRPLVMQGRNLVRQGAQPTVVFPQLAGIKITEFPCPEGCTIAGGGDKAYHNPLHLGTHLRVMHGYDRSEILKYGHEMGIDFSKVPGGKQVLEFDFAKIKETPQPVIEDVPPLFEVVSAAAPASAETAAVFEARRDCPDCGWVNKKNTEQGLAFHRARWCKKQAVPA